MTGSYDFDGDVDGDRQQNEFANATQTTLGDDQRSISIAVTPVFPDGFDVADGAAVEAFMADAMRPLVEAGFEVEVKYGPFDAFSADLDEDEDEDASGEDRD